MEGKLRIYEGARRDDWRTPDSLFRYLDKAYGFTWDLAADFDNAKTDLYFDEDDDSLKMRWRFLESGRHAHWLNPPFSKAKEFFIKAGKEKNSMIAIYKSVNLETPLWQDIILPNADWVCFIRGRVHYLNHRGEVPRKFDKEKGKWVKMSVPFGSALIGYRIKLHPRVEELGKVWKL